MLPEENELSNAEVTDTETDYIGVIEDLKRNTVSKDNYLKLKEENKRLLTAYANGQQLPEDLQPKKKEVNLDEMRTELFTKEHSNLEFVEQALALREAIIEKGGNDPFLPYGEKIMPTNEDIEAANRVATVLKDCVDYADGDSAVFTNELQRRMIDTAPMGKKRK